MDTRKHRCQRDAAEREERIRRITEQIRNDEYVVDAELLADAILRHLGMLAPAARQRTRQGRS
ncbi:MAG: flagellar biosynthesis anti-sigma factor FlgM [Myxococcales bacterium]|nr:flagellar biosynthesis anti-sigma factor FlgM [Myxococcota bacterium]MDW8284134.1 flagellar biosynthesis anti-sigma factor FlgM [Myxococcales bacterium]